MGDSGPDRDNVGERGGLAVEKTLVLFTQRRLLDLTHGVAWQFRHKEGRLGNLVVRQFILHMGYDIGFRQIGTVAPDDDSDTHFAEIGVWHADDGAFPLLRPCRR